MNTTPRGQEQTIEKIRAGRDHAVITRNSVGASRQLRGQGDSHAYRYGQGEREASAGTPIVGEGEEAIEPNIGRDLDRVEIDESAQLGKHDIVKAVGAAWAAASAPFGNSSPSISVLEAMRWLALFSWLRIHADLEIDPLGIRLGTNVRMNWV